MGKNSFENALDELEKIVAELEKGDLPLEEGIEKFKKGMELAEFCNGELEGAEKKISLMDEDGNEKDLDVK